MSAFKKSDVKSDLSRRSPTGIHLHQSASHPDATGFSVEETGYAHARAGHAAQDLLARPGSGVGILTSAPIDSGMEPVLVPSPLKSAQV